jgi:hypothetical protein
MSPFQAIDYSPCHLLLEEIGQIFDNSQDSCDPRTFSSVVDIYLVATLAALCPTMSTEVIYVASI